MLSLVRKTLGRTAEAIRSVIPRTESISANLLEEALLGADMDIDEVERLIDRLVEPITRDRLEFGLLELLPAFEPREISQKPFVELVFGVNGAGKTTTIAKLARRSKDAGKSVIMGAGDTFRAAAVEQLSIWAKRLGVPIVSAKTGGDPSGVAFDTIASALARGSDHALIDTAGRLHTHKNLSEELKKIVRVCGKALEGAPHRKLLVLDGTQGRSAINQAREFHAIIGIDAIAVTKLDGTAKGGAIYSISRALEIPILFIGSGEGAEDLIDFDAREFTAGFVDSFFE
ncbi:MAG: signal recognition particle-docking protein FtsY [Helicobacteraceae bacterium]|jgi:fused signal recognition particle receptor|nr:signal recognition particle-docking protein FtsY [Helicobacteraceae bacterium]